MLNKLDDAWIVTLGNHNESDWHSILKLKAEQIASDDSSISEEKTLRVIEGPKSLVAGLFTKVLAWGLPS